MPSSLWRFGAAVLRIRDEAAAGWGAEELLPILERHPEIVGALHDVGRVENRQHRLPPNDDVLFDLYALGRLVDILISPHQPVNDDPALLAWTTGEPWWSGPQPSPEAWPAFVSAIRAAVIAEDAFHPFFHEIVEVQPADDPDEAPSLVEECWPGALIGGLLLSRAGVIVRAGANRLDRAVASGSCLYWAWWRRNRIARDLSHGWGSNSQWRTTFRRDFIDGDALHFNVDSVGLRDADPEADRDLSTSDRLDLLRFRHSVRRDLGDDRWPYGDTHSETRVR